jgi:hypothetical protein
MQIYVHIHICTYIGFGIDTQITIRNFRGDEPEIEEFVEHWRLLIADYLISKSAIQGVTGSHPLLGMYICIYISVYVYTVYTYIYMWVLYSYLSV